jgi:multicomponent Na+:H+ antiporter subunit E
MKNLFLLNILLTLIWAALTGKFSYGNFIFGFSLTYLILYVLDPKGSRSSYFKRVPQVIGFFVFFIKELIKANIQVAYDVVTPQDYMEPGIVAVPLDAKTDIEISILANLITLTPGTLSLDVSTDRKVLYVHGMYVSDKEKFISDIKNGFEKRLLILLR